MPVLASPHYNRKVATIQVKRLKKSQTWIKLQMHEFNPFSRRVPFGAWGFLIDLHSSTKETESVQSLWLKEDTRSTQSIYGHGRNFRPTSNTACCRELSAETV